MAQLHDKDEKVTEIVSKIKDQLDAKSEKKFESLDVIQYKTDAGETGATNYCVKATATEAGGAQQIVHLMIQQSEDMNLELKAFQLNKQPEDEIKFGCCCA